MVIELPKICVSVIALVIFSVIFFIEYFTQSQDDSRLQQRFPKFIRETKLLKIKSYYQFE